MSDVAQVFTSDNPLVQQLLAGTADAQIKLAAARGALPITPIEQLHVLFALRADDAEDVRAAVDETVRGLDDHVLSTIVRDPAVPPATLDFYARHMLDKAEAVSALLANRVLGDATFVFLAGHAIGTGLELVVTNQVRLIRAQGAIDAALENPVLSTDQRRRLLEIREEFFHKKEREAKRRKEEEERLVRLRAKKEWTQKELEKLQAEVAKETQAEKEAGTLIPDFVESDEADSDDAVKEAKKRVQDMSVPEKVMLAIRGSRTERLQLVRDPNRLVATSAIKSPKITDSEVEHIAGMRNVSDEVLRFVGHKREWLRTYSTLLTLVKNPRTPVAVSMNLLGRVQGKDLKVLTTDRNIAEGLRRQAKQIFDRSQKGAGGRR